MPIFKFRIYLEEDESTYRDIVIKHTQTFFDLHQSILKSYAFDNKHAATFYRSNDQWQRGREISLERYDKRYKVEPLLMAKTSMGSEIQIPNQKFIYTYDFQKNWTFLCELIQVIKEEEKKAVYPNIARTEGIAPPQYGTQELLEKKVITETEEQYDLETNAEGFGEEGEEIIE